MGHRPSSYPANLRREPAFGDESSAACGSNRVEIAAHAFSCNGPTCVLKSEEVICLMIAQKGKFLPPGLKNQALDIPGIF